MDPTGLTRSNIRCKMDQKFCKHCGQMKDSELFPKNSKSRGGRRSKCNVCCNKYVQKTIPHICGFCGKTFEANIYIARRFKIIFCSKQCASSGPKTTLYHEIPESTKVKIQSLFWTYYLSHKEIKPQNCSLCKKQSDVVAHHTDYTMWNKIVWLCKSCHQRVHAGEQLELLEIIL